MEYNFSQGFQIDQTIRTNIRYVLVKKTMEQNFTKWISQNNSINLIKKLIEECKKPNISMVILNLRKYLIFHSQLQVQFLFLNHITS